MSTAVATRLDEIRDRVQAEEAKTPPRRDAIADNIEFRAQDGKLSFTGHAAVFDRKSEDLGGFYEIIQRGAFRKALDKAGLDVRFLKNHNPDQVFARSTISNGAGLLELREDPKGLRVYAELVPTQDAQDLRLLVQAGVISQMSFSFIIGPDGKDVWTEDGGEIVRTIISFGEIFDVGPVVYPAYASTDASMRALKRGVDVADSDEVVLASLRERGWAIHRGEQDASPEERAALDAAFAQTTHVSPWVMQRALQAASQEPELRGLIPGKRVAVSIEDDPGDVGGPSGLAARRRRLRLAGVST